MVSLVCSSLGIRTVTASEEKPYFLSDECFMVWSQTLQNKLSPGTFTDHLIFTEKFDAGFDLPDNGQTDTAGPASEAILEVQQQGINDMNSLSKKLPSGSDYLIAYATVPGMTCLDFYVMLVDLYCTTFNKLFSIIWRAFSITFIKLLIKQVSKI